MDVFDEYLLELWRTINKHGVRYVMIGGVATNFHGYSRATKDADLYIEDTPDNRDRLGSALEEMEIVPRHMMRSFQFVPGWSSLTVGPGLELDMMSQVKGLEEIPFSEIYDMAEIAVVHDVRVPFLHLNHLLQSKRAANRPKDQLDIIELERLDELAKELKNSK